MTLEWFTREAYRALELAREEARGLEHGWLGTEHLLLGLIRLAGEARGATGPRLLGQHGVTAERVRASVMEWLSGSSAAAADGEEPKFTPRMTYVCEHSLQIALELGHRQVGTSHLLLGLLYERRGIGSKVLERLGVTFESVLASANEQSLTETTETSPLEPFTPPVHKTPGANRIPEHARQLAAEHTPDGSVGTHHYLLAVMMERGGLAARALASLGVTYEALKTKLDASDTSDARGYEVPPADSEQRDRKPE